MDQTVAPDMELVLGPGRVVSERRVCAYGPCLRLLPVEAPENQRFCEPRHRTADWKARRTAQAGSGVVAVRSLVGDAENARNGSGRARELRVARAVGRVANDKRVQYSRAVEEVREYLWLLNVPNADQVAREILDRALPARWRS